MSFDSLGTYLNVPSVSVATPAYSTQGVTPLVNTGLDFSGYTPPSASAGSPSILQGMLGSTIKDANGTTIQNPGWGGAALSAGQSLLNAFMGWQQLGLYKDQLAESTRQFNLNYDAQRTTTNTALEDRQRARVASNPNAYQSVSDYMAANSIKAG